MIYTEMLELLTEGHFYTINITDRVQSVVAASNIKRGMVLVFFQHTTGALMVVEHEAGMLVDLEDTLEQVAPMQGDYKHHMRGYDENGASHVRTALLNVSVTLPVSEGKLMLGAYQEILVVDMQTERSPRRVVVQVMGEA